jgi:hypothetical protein
MTSEAIPSNGPAPLPAALRDFESLIGERARSAAFLSPLREGGVAPAGSSRFWGAPDVPADVDWATKVAHLEDSPYDGDSFWLQLNFAEIPHVARNPRWPRQGIAWVFLNLADDWAGRAYFDPRDAKLIPWQPRRGAPSVIGRWETRLTYPADAAKIAPAIFWSGEMERQYEAWHDEDCWRWRNALQVGGWIQPIQGNPDLANHDLVCALENQPFGDAGALYLRFDPATGWSVDVFTH